MTFLKVKPRDLDMRVSSWNGVRRTKRRFLKTRIILLLAAVSLAAAGASGGGPTKETMLLRLEAEYIAYSFDHNQLFARNVSFDLPPYRVSSRTLKVDLRARAFLALGGVALSREGETLRGDALSFDPAAAVGRLLSYGETVETRAVGGPQAVPLPPESLRAAEAVSPAGIRGSLLYAVCRGLDVSADYEAFGKDVVLFVEGLESIGFKSLKLTMAEAVGARRNGLTLNALWFNRSRGLHGGMSYSRLRPGRTDSLTELAYEEHTLVKDFPGPPRQADLKTVNSWTLRPDLGLGLEGNVNSSGLLDARLWLDKGWLSRKISTVFDLTFSRPLGRPSETWIGLKTTVEAGHAGRLVLGGRYETGAQAAGDLAYAASIGKNLNIMVNSVYARLRRGRSGAYSEIFEGRGRLAYTSRFFNLATDYHLNADLAEGRTLRSPQLRMELNPVPLYGGLLLARLGNVFIHNTLLRDGRISSSYSNNTLLGLSAVPFALRPGLLLDFSLALEQFLEKEKRNFTSGGLVVSLKRRGPAGVSLEGFYSLQSRRRTRGGLLEGTTSQDLSAVLRLQSAESLNAWLSASYDPKSGRLKQSFADLTLGVVRGWKFHSLLQYDFTLKKLLNMDLYLIRDAGRFELRFMWRSLSRQILVELLPK